MEEMNEGLIRNYNSVVKPGDTVIWVGDSFFCGSQKAQLIMNRLNGKKILVTGNHDGSLTNSMNCGFDFVCEKLILKIANEEVWVTHYPYAEPKWFTIMKKLSFQKETRYLDRRLKNEGKWLLHGHTHSKYKLRKKEIHVGVDAWGYKPIHMNEIESIIRTGKLDHGKTDYDNRFEYSIKRMGFVRSWVKGITRLWSRKTNQNWTREAEISEEATVNNAEHGYTD